MCVLVFVTLKQILCQKKAVLLLSHYSHSTMKLQAVDKMEHIASP